MAKTNPKTIIIKMRSKKIGPGRPRKDVIINNSDMEETVGLPGTLQPTERDLYDELSRLDSFIYSRYTEI
jgi:hypothetical protein